MTQGAWPTRSLAEISERVDYGLTASAVSEPVGPRFLRITDIVPDQIDWSSVPYCAVKSDAERDRYLVRGGDIVIARTGATVGYSKSIQVDTDAVFASYLVRVRPGPDVDARYVGYIIGSDHYKRFVQASAGGVAQPNASAPVLTSYQVPCPPLEMQRAIGVVLSSFDSMIAVNNRRITLLNEAARRLYREWFLRYRFPGHEQTGLIDSELGAVPEGWDIGALAERVRVTVGGDWGKDEPESVDWVIAAPLRGADLPRLRKGDPSSVQLRWIKASSLEKRRVAPTDVIVEGSGHCGRSLAADPELERLIGLPVIYSNFCKRLRCSSSAEAMFVCHLFDSMIESGEMANFQTGVAIQNLNLKGLVESRMVAWPPDGLLEQFGEITRPMLQVALNGENQRLREVRDLLVSRFLSGQLDAAKLALAAGSGD